MARRCVFVVFTALSFLSFNYVSGQLQPEDEVCQSIIDAASSSVDPVCQPLGDCTGISCESSQLNRTVEIVVDKCTDPLEVNVTIYRDGLLTESLIVTGTGPILDGKYTVDIFTRDSQVAAISISYTADGQNQVVIPTTEVPLNASVCTCEAIKRAGQNIESPVETTCETNAACTGQDCTFQALGQDLFLESELVPCGDPPGFVFVVRDVNHQVLYEGFFDQDQNETFLGMPLVVKVKHREYSTTVSGMLLSGNEWHAIIPETQVFIDTSMCLKPSSVTIMTVSATPTPSSTPGQTLSPQTCDAIEGIRDQANTGGLVSCSVDRDDCDTLTCAAFNEYTLSFQLLPCVDPVAVHVTIYDSTSKIYDRVISNTTHIPIGTTGNEVVVGLKQDEDSISVKVDVNFGLLPIPIIPETKIPIDTCYCPGVHCSAASSSAPSTALSGGRPATSTSSSVTTVPTSSSVTNIPTSSSITTITGQSVNVAVAVAVPLVILVLLVVIVIIAVIGVLILMGKLKIKGSDNQDSISIKEMIYANEEDDEIIQ